MSTTINVYPQTLQFPSFREVLVLATTRVDTFLAQHYIRQSFAIELYIKTKEGDINQPLNLDAPAIWSDDCYAWFFVPLIPGGTDGYFWPLDESHRDEWEHLLLRMQGLDEERKKWLQDCLASGYRWNFRRSAGQPAIIHVVYGFIAAAFAELTNGFLYSDDSAWDYQRFPATSAEFYEWYFQPSLALDPKNAAWAEEFIAAIQPELTSRES